jgi:hypothetical protein
MSGLIPVPSKSGLFHVKYAAMGKAKHVALTNVERSAAQQVPCRFVPTIVPGGRRCPDGPVFVQKSTQAKTQPAQPSVSGG